MALNLALTPGQVQEAVETVKRNNPLDEMRIEFYGRIFVAQEESRSHLRIEPIRIPGEILSVKAIEKLPLVEIRQFVFDETETAKLFLTLCRIAEEEDTGLAAAAKTLLNAKDTESRSAAFCTALLGGDEALFESAASELQIDKQILGFFALNSLIPSLSVCADHLSAYLDPDDPWWKGDCPVCGSAPILSILADRGARHLVCSFCRHRWQVKRVYCPFCGNSEDQKLHYFFVEEEPDLRVDVCDDCKKYIKTVDARKAGRLLYPPLEQVSTLHLDIKAREMGFESGTRLFMQL
jgi:FdhE protein